MDGSVIAVRRDALYHVHMMLAVVYWKATVGIAVILAVFGMFAWLLARSKRTHRKCFGGISYWEVMYGRFPGLRRRKPKP